MPLTEFPAADAAAPTAAAKPAGVPGKYVVVGVVVACVVITAGFLFVKATRGNPGAKNEATLLFTEGLGALERHSSLTAAAVEASEAGDAAKADDYGTRASQELEAAEKAFERSASSAFGPPMARGWLAEVKRRRGELTEAERLFTRAIEGPADAVVTDPQKEARRRAAFTPDPADLGGRALVRAAEGNPAGAADDARRALELYTAGAKTRAANYFAEFAPDRGELRRLAGVE